MGSSTAFNLMKSNPGLGVVVVEKDSSYSKASTTLSMANVRTQFSLRENIQISKYAFEVLENFETEMAVGDLRPEISFHREGNLFLVDKSSRETAEKALALQKDLGCPVEWWSLEMIQKHYPLYDPKGFVGGTFGPGDGYLDAYSFLMGYRKKARSLGAEYIEDEVARIMTGSGSVTGVLLASGGTLGAPFVVNCAGAWCADVAKTAGVNIPVIPVQRQVFVLDTAVKPPGPLPLTILPSGLYFRTETGGLILLGKSFPEDPVGYDFQWDEKRFTEVLWPELAGFVPAFDTLRLIRGWVGLYEVNTLDSNAILGKWPELQGLLLAVGFSGHGVQQAPAVGRYLAEIILGLPHALDLAIFSPERILQNKPINEAGIV